jgi:DNA repair exonuclease SbcCD ATPase subunit
LLVKKVEELTSLFDKVQGEFRNFKTESESTVAKLRRENMELKEHCRDAQEMLQSVQEKTRLDLENRDSRIDRLELELEHVKMNPVKRIKTSPEKVQVQSVSGIEKKDWDMLSSLHDSSQKRVKELERQNSDLVKSNEFFKSMHENSEKLREKIRTMEHQVELFGSTRQELAKVQLECQELVRDKEEWFRVCGERGFTSPFQVFEKLNGLKMNEIKLVQEVKELELQLRSFKESSDQDRELSSNALKELETLKALFSEKETILKRSDVRVTILQSENSRLKELLVLLFDLV